MIRIKTMRAEDIPFAVWLSSQEKWGTPRRDFGRILRLNRRGSFVAVHNSTRVGITTTMAYGRKLAWIGNVIVRKDYRGKHIGQKLIEHATEHLRHSGTNHIGLYCFSENVKFYERLGFLRDAQFLRLRRRETERSDLTLQPKQETKVSLDRVTSADRRAFGADRSRLIHLLLSEGSAWDLRFASGNRTISYLFVKGYNDMNELGPWISFSDQIDEQRRILGIALNKAGKRPIEVSCLSSNQKALNILRGEGFQGTRNGYRMYLQERVRIGDDPAQYALGFLDKG